MTCLEFFQHLTPSTWTADTQLPSSVVLDIHGCLSFFYNIGCPKTVTSLVSNLVTFFNSNNVNLVVFVSYLKELEHKYVPTLFSVLRVFFTAQCTIIYTTSYNEAELVSFLSSSNVSHLITCNSELIFFPSHISVISPCISWSSSVDFSSFSLFNHELLSRSFSLSSLVSLYILMSTYKAELVPKNITGKNLIKYFSNLLFAAENDLNRVLIWTKMIGQEPSIDQRRLEILARFEAVSTDNSFKIFDSKFENLIRLVIQSNLIDSDPEINDVSEDLVYENFYHVFETILKSLYHKNQLKFLPKNLPEFSPSSNVPLLVQLFVSISSIILISNHELSPFHILSFICSFITSSSNTPSKFSEVDGVSTDIYVSACGQTISECSKFLPKFSEISLFSNSDLISLLKNEPKSNVQSFSELIDHVTDPFSLTLDISSIKADLISLLNLIFSFSLNSNPFISASDRLIIDQCNLALSKLSHLPVHSHANDLLSSIKANRVVSLGGATGSGKSSYTPLLILANFPGSRIIITQPRRIAAIKLAQRLAELTETKLGDLVGYRIRGESTCKKTTRIEFQTVGFAKVFTCFHPEQMSAYDFIMIDEVHERSTDLDCTMALVRRLLYRNQSKLIVSSATLQAQTFCDFFRIINKDIVPTVSAGSGLFDVAIYHMDEFSKYSALQHLSGKAHQFCSQKHAGRKVWFNAAFVAEVIVNVLTRGTTVLVFLAGIDQIEEVYDQLSGIVDDATEICVLHSIMTTSDQAKSLAAPKSFISKVVLSTDIAESSLTVAKVTTVIDGGYHKRLKMDNNRLCLDLEKIGRSSSIQRSGRAGRLCPGVCIRLYSQADYRSRREFDTPEVLSSPLTQVVLAVKAIVPGSPSKFLAELPEPPCYFSLISAINQLYIDRALFANNELSSLTYFGNILQLLPIDPNLVRLVHGGLIFDEVLPSLMLVSIITSTNFTFQPSLVFQKAPEYVRRCMEIFPVKYNYSQTPDGLVCDLFGMYNLAVDFLNESHGHMSADRPLRSICERTRTRVVYSTFKDLAYRLLVAKDELKLSNSTADLLSLLVSHPVVFDHVSVNSYRPLALFCASTNVFEPNTNALMSLTCSDILVSYKNYFNACYNQEFSDTEVNDLLQRSVWISPIQGANGKSVGVMLYTVDPGVRYFSKEVDSVARSVLVFSDSGIARGFMSLATDANIKIPLTPATVNRVLQVHNIYLKKNQSALEALTSRIASSSFSTSSDGASLIIWSPRRYSPLTFDKRGERKTKVSPNSAFYGLSTTDLTGSYFTSLHLSVLPSKVFTPSHLTLVPNDFVHTFMWITMIPSHTTPMTLFFNDDLSWITRVCLYDCSSVSLTRAFPASYLSCINTLRLVLSVADFAALQLKLWELPWFNQPPVSQSEMILSSSVVDSRHQCCDVFENIYGEKYDQIIPSLRLRPYVVKKLNLKFSCISEDGTTDCPFCSKIWKYFVENIQCFEAPEDQDTLDPNHPLYPLSESEEEEDEEDSECYTDDFDNDYQHNSDWEPKGWGSHKYRDSDDEW
ncbi:hypothetical protein RCL1_001888 [Eukaryota sp. TZLM3-RCL]